MEKLDVGGLTSGRGDILTGICFCQQKDGPLTGRASKRGLGNKEY